MQGAMQIAQQVVAHDGIGGLYRGFGTVILGVIPARAVQCRMSLCRGVTVSAHTRAILPVMLHMAAQVYLTTLEAVKSWSLSYAMHVAPTEAVAAGLSNFCAGCTASLVTQSVIVPVDVVSQKLMVAGWHCAPMTTPQYVVMHACMPDI